MSSTSSSFKAIVASAFGGPEVLKLSSRSMEELSPAANQVLVEIHAAGVNPSDTYVRLGPQGPWAATPHLLPTPPYTGGKDGAGIVVAVGDGTPTAPPLGSRVYTTGSLSGTYAEYALCDVKSVHALPPNISFAQGACVGVPCATAHHALARCRAKPGDNVFVHGASGAVGLAAVQLATDMGCAVVGSAGSAEGEAAVLAAGAIAAVNHRAVDYLAAVEAAAADKFDLILEMAAHANLVADLGLLRRGGQLAVIGSKAQPIELNPRLLMPNELSIRGIFLPTQSEAESKETHAALYAAMEKGALAPVVATEIPLAEAPKAHVEVMEPSSGGKAGNVVLMVR